MAAITRAEVKKYILLKDTIVPYETVTLPATTAPKRLTYPNVTSIIKVTTSTQTSASTYTSGDYSIATDFQDYTLISGGSTGGFSTAKAIKVSYKYNSYNDDIDNMIPVVEKDVCDYLNNYFEDRIIFVQYNGGIAFVKGATEADKITDDNQHFSTAGFVAGMDVAVRGGSNAGIYTLAAVSSGTLTLDSTGAILSQDQDNTYNPAGAIRISRIGWPEELKPYIAQMIWYRINKSRPNNILSEKIDDYSVTYINGNAYPTETLSGLKKFRRVVLV